MKSLMAIFALFIASAAAAVDVTNDPSLLLSHKNLETAMDQVVTSCANQGMEIVQQTRNTVVCSISVRDATIELHFSLIKLSTGVRVSWTERVPYYDGVQAGNGIPNALIQGVILQADPNYHFAKERR